MSTIPLFTTRVWFQDRERHGNTDLLCLSKVGFVEIRLHRQPSNIKQVSVTKKASGRKWFANIVCEEARPLVIPKIDTSKCVGIDVGITKFVHDSDNHSQLKTHYF